jgi:cyclic 2,3-diphosphoglycerate synthetase
MAGSGVIALIDGEHHPGAVREVLERLESELGLTGVVFCGGEEKLPEGPLESHYGRPVDPGPPEDGLRRLAGQAGAVVDLADEPVLPASRKLALAALALELGLRWESPGMSLAPPRLEPVQFSGPTLAVIGTGKRTGKTALAQRWASILREAGHDPAIVCMGRGGPAEPRVAEPGLGLDELIELAEAGEHAASDYLEDAVLAGVRAIGCRRVGGGLGGAPAESNVRQGAALAASLGPDVLLFEGSGSCIPPVEVDRTVCVAGAAPPEPFDDLRLARADLVLLAGGSAHRPPPGRATIRFELRPEPLEDLPAGARVACFTTGGPPPDGCEAAVVSNALARRGELARDLERAARERCDLYLTELKAAAIDTVAVQARRAGARVVFLRNRPYGTDGDLDSELVKLCG